MATGVPITYISLESTLDPLLIVRDDGPSPDPEPLRSACRQPQGGDPNPTPMSSRHPSGMTLTMSNVHQVRTLVNTQPASCPPHMPARLLEDSEGAYAARARGPYATTSTPTRSAALSSPGV